MSSFKSNKFTVKIPTTTKDRLKSVVTEQKDNKMTKTDDESSVQQTVSSKTYVKKPIYNQPTNNIIKQPIEQIPLYKPKIERSSEYNLVLLYVNKILKNNNKPEITDLKQFKDIFREEIIRPENLSIYQELEFSIFLSFKKMKRFRFEHLNKENIVFNILKSMIKNLKEDVKLTSFRKDIPYSKGFRKAHMLYTIS